MEDIIEVACPVDDALLAWFHVEDKPNRNEVYRCSCGAAVTAGGERVQ